MVVFAKPAAKVFDAIAGFLEIVSVLKFAQH